MKRINHAIFILLLGLFSSISIDCSKTKQPNIITLKENGGWCWFQDERVIIHDGILIFGSVADTSGKNGDKLNGNVEVTSYDLRTNKHLGSYVLHERLEADDHNVPAFILLNDKRILVVYSKHGSDKYIRYRISTNPMDCSNWQPENKITRLAGVTYSNLHFLSSENNDNGRIYNFYRGENWNPNFIISDNFGKSWQYGGHLISFKGRPYVKYTSNCKDKIHFITTEHHPRNCNTGIYHAYYQDGKLYKSDETFISNINDGPILPTDATKIFHGDSLNIAWTVDIHLDKQENPYIAYSVKQNQNPYSLYYRYARWNGEIWQDFHLAHADTALYPRESDYSGLVALDPDNPNIVYISSDVNPVSGEELISTNDNIRHYEIFKGQTKDRGQTWKWAAITENSTFDNIRPIMPKSDGRYKALLWLKGTYNSYTNYDLDVVGIVNL